MKTDSSEGMKNKTITKEGTPKALSIFSGAGGMDIGIERAGFKVLACIEIDPHCCESLRATAARANKTKKVIEADIRTVKPEKLMVELNLLPGQLDLLFGGFDNADQFSPIPKIFLSGFQIKLF